MANRADRRPEPNGVAVVDKPAGWTSHDVVAKTRGILRTRKIGHSGTLDPAATGVLVLGVGAATRLLRFLTALPKSYVAEIVFGVETSTLDAEAEVISSCDMSSLTPETVRTADGAFVGDIEQVPPMVSAIKIGGRRLHELAREGIEVDRPARPVTVHRFALEPIETTGPHPVYRAEVDCSSGTYVRSLAADLGRALGGSAHLRALRRTAVGSFTLADAHPIESPRLLPVQAAVRGLPGVTVDADVAALVRNGRVLDRDVLGLAAPAGRSGASGPWPVYGPDGTLLAVYEPHRDDRVKPAVVLAAASRAVDPAE
jgi:tRNA pseudouridine55 synthase